jgi:hypothetical protein
MPVPPGAGIFVSAADGFAKSCLSHATRLAANNPQYLYKTGRSEASSVRAPQAAYNVPIFWSVPTSGRFA